MPATTTADPVVRSAARWFWWIAGLSLVNVVLFYSGSNTSFVVGLAMTMFASVAFAGNLPVAIGLAGLTVAFYLVVGLYAQRQKLWAFYLGLAVYVLDGLIYAYFSGLDVRGLSCARGFLHIQGHYSGATAQPRQPRRSFGDLG